ncbi:MAG: nuclear transport factor 2 family protein [Hassallia sp. WJT32-NPBG1]|jgi:hypothetical protein|nr:nuclear transport factor 2 family protein [Hassallia sp. WJT32-NPBG1]
MLIQKALIGVTLMLGLLTIAPQSQADITNIPKVNTSAETVRQKNEQTIRRYFELLSQKRMDEWLKLWADDGVQDMPYSPAGFPNRVEGKAAVAKHYSALPTSVGRMVFPDLKIYPTTDPNRHLRKLMHDPSPNLSPKRREALIPPSLVGKGGRGLGLRVNLRFLNLFRRCLILSL